MTELVFPLWLKQFFVKFQCSLFCVTRGFSILEDLQVQKDFCVTPQFSKKVTEFLCTHMYNYYRRNSGLQIKFKHMEKRWKRGTSGCASIPLTKLIHSGNQSATNTPSKSIEISLKPAHLPLVCEIPSGIEFRGALVLPATPISALRENCPGQFSCQDWWVTFLRKLSGLAQNLTIQLNMYIFCLRTISKS